MTVATNKETLGFQTEVKQLLRLVVNSLYSNKEIFLRELISNASDAADRLRFEALSDSALYEDDSNLEAVITFDKDARIITIADNGIGMSREDVIEHIGTIAKSGTREFLSHLTGDQKKDAHLIGQFGVGFYSSFIVADQVTLETRRAGLTKEHGVRWHSDGTGEYTLENIEKPQRGTVITLHLKEGDNEFLDAWRLRSVITKYSDHINLPIKMYKLEMPDDKKEEKAEKQEPELEVVNRAKALWTLPKNQITDEQYKELYKHISHDFEDPMTWVHNRVEGKLDYISLLYIPSHAPFDLWNREMQRGLKLYVQRTFIMDDAEQFLPLYLRFIKGIIDTRDLPLNISREILQDNQTIKKLRAALVSRVLGMLEDLATKEPEKYQSCWQAFGNVLKEGPAEDFANRERLAKLFRFSSTHTNKEEQTVTFADYVSRMKPNQKHIYYITAENFIAAKSSPHLEVFKEKGIEVLLLSDRVDEWLVGHLPEFDGKALHSVSKGELKLDDIASEEQKSEAEKKAEAEQEQKTSDDFSSTIEQVKKILADKVKEVRLTHRLKSSPACLVVDEHDMGPHLKRILQAAGQDVPTTKPIFELNPDHHLVQKLKDEQNMDRLTDWTNILFDQAVLAEGGHLEDPAGFVGRLNKLLLELAS